MYLTLGIRMICVSPITLREFLSLINGQHVLIINFRHVISIDYWCCFLASISQEGLLWFQNLAEADPYGILPFGFLLPSLIGVTVGARSFAIEHVRCEPIVYRSNLF
jgi:hypothetical protein